MTMYTFIYNKIQDFVSGPKILEIGCSGNIYDSELKEKIINSDYFCMDIVENEYTALVGDIVEYDLIDKYDTILMIEVLEHIHLRDWINVINKLKKRLQPEGKLIVSVPAHQQLEKYLDFWNQNYYQIHTVFGITKKSLQKLFPDCEISLARHVVFNEDKKEFLWALGRFVKRLLFQKDFPLFRDNFILVWSWKNENSM